MKKLLYSFLLLIVSLSVLGQKMPTETVIDLQIIRENLIGPYDFKPIPQAKDTFWRQEIPENMRLAYIKLGHSFQGKKWIEIDDSVFAEYKTIGNQANYQRLNFNIRRQMACLVMAEILEHKGHLLKDIANGLDFFIRETWWGISAHYPKIKPETNIQVVDLFNAETANMLAWTVYMLQDELDSLKPGICDAVRSEINRRFLAPARTEDYSWKKKVDNWNTWICANWLSCVLLCETNREQQISDIELILSCLNTFYKGYPNDGGCDEGVHYWDRAAASFFECIRMLGLATNGHFSMKSDVKFREMGSFVYKMYICKNSCVNFADALSNTLVNINILYPYGNYINDTLMTNYAALIAEQRNYKEDPTFLFFNSGNYPSLSRELLFLSEYKSFERCRAGEPIMRDVLLPDLQVFTARSSKNSTKGPFVAAKGGHNAEMHNHNDVGSFIAYSNTEPLLIDIGFATYNAKTFSNRRYELTNCRSAFHNVPLINGIEQIKGKEHKAKDVKYNKTGSYTSFALNIEDAYPNTAEVDKWRRTIRLNRGKNIVVTEDFKLRKFVKPTEIVLVCYGEPKIKIDGEIELNSETGNHFICYDSKMLTPAVERIDITDPAVVDTWSKKPLYRIRLKLNTHQLKGTIRYSIR